VRFMVEVRVASDAGYCYGVERALRMTSKASTECDGPIYTLGPIIHNPQVVQQFVRDGVAPVENVAEVLEGTIIVRTHGVDPLVIEEASERGLRVIDATCPFVAKAQKKAAELVAGGYRVFIVGERNHPEVVGILAHAGGNAIVVEQVGELGKLKKMAKVGVVVQTTQPLATLQEVVSHLITAAAEIKVFNTICNATVHRQNAAGELATEADLMVVVGGKNSANTTRLAQICEAAGTETLHIETAADLPSRLLVGREIIGVTAGASTPEWLLVEVVDKIKAIVEGDGT